MSAANLPILEEYDSMYAELGDHGSAFFKFFDLFRVILGESDETPAKGIHYGKDCHDDNIEDDLLKAFKVYLKQQKTWIKKEGKKASALECRRRMWFFMSKLKEWDIFDMRIRRDISFWMDVCMERTMEGTMVRLEYFNGQPILAKLPDGQASGGK